MALHEHSILVKLTIKQWDGFRKDKRVAEHVDKEYSTGGKAGNYNKRLFDKNVLHPIQKVANKMRKEHANMTMPFAYDGASVLPNKLYFEYTQVYRNFDGMFNVAVQNFITQYPVHKRNQIQQLGGLYNPDEYPEPHELASKFSMQVRFFPVPTSGHFMADIPDRETLARELTAEMEDVQRNAMADLYARIKDMLDHMHERLSDPGHIFRDSMVENLEQLMGVLPGLNIFNDPVLTQVHKRLNDELLVATPEELRMDMPLRRNISNIAFDLSNLLSGKEAK